MISIQLAAGIFTALIIFIGIIHLRMEKRIKRVKRLEMLLSEARRELSSLEMLKSRILGRIGDVLSEPLTAIEATSQKLGRDNPSLPEEVVEDLRRLSEEVHSLVRILTVFEQISQDDKAGDGETGSLPDQEQVCFDEIVSEAAMELSDVAADRTVSLSVSIAGDARTTGSYSQLTEAVTSLLRESLKRAASGTLLTIELSKSRNIELEIRWTTDESGSETRTDENLLGTGLTRLIASSHGGWLSEDPEEGRIRLILPKAGDSNE